MYKQFWKFILEWAYPLGRPECPYAYRWRLDLCWFSFRIHKWLASDDVRAYHNHPWHFITFVLKGSYLDVQPKDCEQDYPYLKGQDCCSYDHVSWFRFRHKDHRHYVSIVPADTPIWTFVITFGKPRRYSFWLADSRKKKNRDKYFIEHGEAPCAEHIRAS